MKKSRLVALLSALMILAAMVVVVGCGSSDDDSSGSDITSVDDLAGKVVGAQNGTTGLDYAKNKTDAARVQGYPNGPAAIEAVKNGQVDATIIDQPVAQDAVKKDQTGFKVAQVIETGENYGFAFSKDSTALVAGVNKALADLNESGEFNDIYKKWFGIDAPESITSGLTATEEPNAADIDSELSSSGTLTVGSDIPYPPFEFGNPPNYTGFDIDLVNAIGKDLNLPVKIQDTSFDTIFTDVGLGKFDMVASAASITPEREKTVAFSDPYYASAQALLVPDDSE